MNFKKELNKKKGFALTEVLLAIAVIVIIGIGAYGLYKSSREKAVVMSVTNAMTYISTKMDEQKTMLSGSTSGGSKVNFAQYMSQVGLLQEGQTYNADGGNDLNIPGTDMTMQAFIAPPSSGYTEQAGLLMSAADVGSCPGIIQSFSTLFNSVSASGMPGLAVVGSKGMPIPGQVAVACKALVTNGQMTLTGQNSVGS